MLVLIFDFHITVYLLTQEKHEKQPLFKCSNYLTLLAPGWTLTLNSVYKYLNIDETARTLILFNACIILLYYLCFDYQNVCINMLKSRAGRCSLFCFVNSFILGGGTWFVLFPNLFALFRPKRQKAHCFGHCILQHSIFLYS